MNKIALFYMKMGCYAIPLRPVQWGQSFLSALSVSGPHLVVYGG